MISMDDLRNQLITLVNFRGTPKEESERYCELLHTILSNTGAELIDTLKLFVGTIISEHVNLVVSRPMLNYVVVKLSQLPDELSKEVLHFALDKVRPRVLSFGEQVDGIRQHLVQIYVRNQEWLEAANILDGVLWESATVDYKLKTCLQIIHLYLEDDYPEGAQFYVNKASLLQAETTNNELKILYKVYCAQVLDYRHDFIEAAQRYYELSYLSALCETERMIFLKKALVCTVLASVGEQRSEMLNILLSDVRCQCLSAYYVLENMYLDRMICRFELKEIEVLLEPRQNITTDDGLSILDRATLENNLLLGSKLYYENTFEELAALLEITSLQVENVALQMITQGRLNGYIDYTEGVIYFEDPENLQQ